MRIPGAADTLDYKCKFSERKVFMENRKTCAGHMLTADEYQADAMRTVGEASAADRLLNGVMGLAGESGKCLELLKKTMFQGHPFNTAKLIEELGDAAWYLATAAGALGVNLSDVLMRNIEKRRLRYPNGFSAKASINRQDPKSESAFCRVCHMTFIPAAADDLPCTYDPGLTERWTKCPVCGRGVRLEVF